MLAAETKTTIRERELQRLAQELGRAPEPKEVLEAARPKNSPLHDYFDWDDSVAGAKWRLQQAYQLMISCRLEVQYANARKQVPEMASVRLFVNTARDQGYMLRSDVLSNKAQRAAMVEMKLRELRSWTDSVADISELAEIRDAIRKMLNA